VLGIANVISAVDWVQVAIGIIAAILLGIGLYCARQKLLIDNLPVSKTTGVFIGEVELEGAALTEAPVTSFLAQARCAWYHYEVEEEWERTTTSTDSDGKSTTQTESGWETVAEGGSDDTPFFLKDDRGSIRLQPKGAEVRADKAFDRQCHAGDPLYYGKGPRNSIANSTGKRRFTEHVILPGAPLFVVGHARVREDAVAAELASHPHALYVISTSPKAAVSSSYRSMSWFVPGFALVAGTAALAGWDYKLHHHIAPLSAYAWKDAAYLAAWLLGWAWMAFNSLVELRQRVAQGWANIDVELKRRAELIPNLVKLVTGMRDHEARVQTEVAALRTQSGATAPGTVGPDPAAVARPLRAIAEAYPELKANALFLKLQQQISQTEDRIALARAYFNEIATFYNTRLAVFPDGLLARLGGMRPRALLDAAAFKR